MSETKNDDDEALQKVVADKVEFGYMVIRPTLSFVCRQLLVAVQDTEMPNIFFFIRSHINISHPSLLLYFIFSLRHFLSSAERGKELAAQHIGSPANKG
jgi:hypothetical protein